MTEQDGTKNKLTQDGIDDILNEIKGQLTREADRKTSLEQRAITVITTSSALATVVFTVVAAITKIPSVENFVKAEHIWIQIGVGMFLLAALVALGVNIPIPYGQIKPDSITPLANWVADNRNSTTDTHVGIAERLVNNGIKDLKVWQNRNSTKAIVLEVAFTLEVLAVASLGVALVIILAKI